MPITDGDRHNLILWFRASQIRNVVCPMCGHAPELVPVDAGGDGFTSGAAAAAAAPAEISCELS